MLDKLEELCQRFDVVLSSMAEPDVISDQKQYQALAAEHRQLEPVIETYSKYKHTKDDLDGAVAMLEDEDPEIREMAEEEAESLRKTLEELEQDLHVLLLPKDPLDEKNVILEVRAGTGGDEAALFAADVFRMYTRYADNKGWKVELMSKSETELGGLKEVVCSIDGTAVYSRLKYESGVHRVQRVPATETQGRIHTSACTVAILPEADEVDIDIAPNELEIDVYRSSGPGGQSVNTTDSAVRITHKPTGLVVTCQDEKSQHKNKAKALKVLRSRLLEKAQAEAHEERAANRRSQVGTGDRSERIRTYNFPQNRLSDHRVGLTLYKLEQIMMGDIEQVLTPVEEYFIAEALKQTSES